MNSKVIVDVANKSDVHAWNEYIAKKDNTTCFNRYEWSSILAESCTSSPMFLIARRDQEVSGVFPIYQLNNHTLSQQVSVKNGLIAEDSSVANALFDYLNKAMGDTATINFSSPFSFDFPKLKLETKTTLILNLENDADAMWRSLRSKTRNMIRKSQKNSLVLKKGIEYLDTFYRIYSDRMARKNIPFPPYDFFKRSAEIFKNDLQIYIAEKNGKAIASILVLLSHNTASYAYSAFMPGSEQYSPIHFLLWELINDCIHKKVTLIDMGESSIGSGVYNFKIWMGAEPKTFYNYQTYLEQKPKFSFTSSLKSRINTQITSRLPLAIRKQHLIRQKKTKPLI